MSLCCMYVLMNDFYACIEFPRMWNHFIPIKNKLMRVLKR
jgi:hypothetical protein